MQAVREGQVAGTQGTEQGTQAGQGEQASQAEQPGQAETVEPDILLMGCVKGKLEWASKVEAKDLYVSALWRSRRRYAEQSGIPWFILSAKYGLISPETRIAWYDLSLGDLPAAHRRSWSQRVVDSLVARYPSVKGMAVEIHAGKDYIDFGLESGLVEAGMVVQRPLLGVPIGRHLGWYRDRGAGEE